MNLQAAIDANRRRQARYQRAERVLRAVRLRVFEYEDAGKADKAARVIATCKRILAPLWQAHADRRERLATDRLMHRDT